MRQLIARIDEKLHRQLKARAASEGRSLNALVTDVLRSAVDQKDGRTGVFARLESAGLLVVPPVPRRAPSRKAAIALTKGTGRAASRALEADRRRR